MLNKTKFWRWFLRNPSIDKVGRILWHPYWNKRDKILLWPYLDVRKGDVQMWIAPGWSWDGMRRFIFRRDCAKIYTQLDTLQKVEPDCIFKNAGYGFGKAQRLEEKPVFCETRAVYCGFLKGKKTGKYAGQLRPFYGWRTVFSLCRCPACLDYEATRAMEQFLLDSFPEWESNGYFASSTDRPKEELTRNFGRGDDAAPDNMGETGEGVK